MLEKFAGFKTLLFNALALAVGLAQALGGPLPEIDPTVWAVALPVSNIVLRFLTRTPVGQSTAQ